MGLLYVVAAPVVMALVALIGGDKFATVGGVIAIPGPCLWHIGGGVVEEGISARTATPDFRQPVSRFANASCGGSAAQCSSLTILPLTSTRFLGL